MILQSNYNNLSIKLPTPLNLNINRMGFKYLLIQNPNSLIYDYSSVCLIIDNKDIINTTNFEYTYTLNDLTKFHPHEIDITVTNEISKIKSTLKYHMTIPKFNLLCSNQSICSEETLCYDEDDI